MTPPTPSPPGECVPPAFSAGGGHSRWVERGWGVNSSEDARHCSVLYIRKYFVILSIYQHRIIIKRNLILRDMSSSSPPQPQNWFENPLSSCMCSADRADTPPNRSCTQKSTVSSTRIPARQLSVSTACKASKIHGRMKCMP